MQAADEADREAKRLAMRRDAETERGGPCGTTDDVRCAMRDLTGQPVEIVKEDEAKGELNHAENISR